MLRTEIILKMIRAKILLLTIFCLFSLCFCTHNVLGEEVTKENGVIPYREWKDYTVEEKEILKNRWTDVDKYENIRKYILDKKQIPEDVLIIKGSDGMEKYDLRSFSATLFRDYLQGADLNEANLQGAYLEDADLHGADLSSANLQGANLFGSKFGSTFLWRANLGEAENIRYIEWKEDYYIGEEFEETFGGWEKGKAQKERDLKNAEITYSDLKSFYKERRMSDIASEFHYRENVVKTKISSSFFKAFRTVFLDWTYGYGSRPLRLIPFCFGVILVFAFIYLLLTLPRKTDSGIFVVTNDGRKEELLPIRKGKILLDCFYFSLLSFATFGYGALQPKQWLQFFYLEPVEFKPRRWARIFVGFEAAIGIYRLALTALVLFKG